MRERLTIFLTIAVVVALLVALNAASYVRVEDERDSEFRPDRSTFNGGATGTRALYEFLQETGHSVVRWRESPASLLTREGERPSTFVVVGSLRREFANEEARALLRWVREDGGRLVVIDRAPDVGLLPASGRWRISSELVEFPDPTIYPDDAEAMTRGVTPLTAAQPSPLMRGVGGVARSRFAGRLRIYTIDEKTAAANAVESSPEDADNDWPFDSDRQDETPVEAGDETKGQTTESPSTELPHASPSTELPPASSPTELPPASSPTELPPASETMPGRVVVSDDAGYASEREGQVSPAPVEHLADGREGSGALLVDYAYGRGRILVLSDPFIVSNVGLALADNLPLAVNLVAAADGVIAFDEYHQGRGATANQTLAYFRGTPVLAIAAQGALLLLAFVWTRSRRFARPLPAPRIDRRSKLEYVASMAELQQRARAYDLAIENIYGRTRRALARYAGLAASAPDEEIAARVAARSGRDVSELRALLRECEDSMAGTPLSARGALQIIARLRELEAELGIRMRSREIRQAQK